MKNPDSGDLLCVGKVVGVHGLRGGLKVQSFMEDPKDLFCHGPVFDQEGAHLLTFKEKRQPNQVGEYQRRPIFLVYTQELADRTAAEAFGRPFLFLPKDVLPALTEDQTYRNDWVGCMALDAGGKVLGRVVGFQDFGGGPLIEVAPVKKALSPDKETKKHIFDNRKTVLIPDSDAFCAAHQDDKGVWFLTLNPPALAFFDANGKPVPKND